MVCAIKDPEWDAGMAALNDAVEHGVFKGREGERVTVALCEEIKAKAEEVIRLATRVGKLDVGYLDRWAVIVGPLVRPGEAGGQLVIALVPVK